MLGQPWFLLCPPSRGVSVREQGAQCAVLLGHQAMKPGLKPSFASYQMGTSDTHMGLVSC